jgi:hypothetical protein
MSNHQRNRTAVRIFLDILIFLSLIKGWWILALIFVFIALFAVSNFLEIIFFGMMYDAIFGIRSISYLSSHTAIIVSLVLYIGAYYMRSIIRK